MPAPLARYFTKKNVMNIIIAGVLNGYVMGVAFWVLVSALNFVLILQGQHGHIQPTQTGCKRWSLIQSVKIPATVQLQKSHLEQFCGKDLACMGTMLLGYTVATGVCETFQILVS